MHLYRIERNANDNFLRLYPSPASDELFFDTGSETTAALKVTVFNVQGDIVITANLNAQKNIDIRSLSAGMYFVVCETGNRSFRGKFVKE